MIAPHLARRVTARFTRRMTACIAGACLVALVSGCGPAALIHDAYLGPISPAGRIHPLLADGPRRFGSRAVGVTASGRGLLRPITTERLIDPGNARTAAVAVQRRLSGMSFVIDGSTTTGRVPAADAVAHLEPALDERDVLTLLGPPDLWLRRRASRVMAWRGRRESVLRIRLGVPPGVPIPGISNLSWRWHGRDVSQYRLFALFDAEGRLVEWFRGGDDTRADDTED